jgi:hydrogenase maturation protease
MRYIIGIGNYWMYDDSIGLHIIEHIAENDLLKNFDQVEAIDLSANVLNLFSYLSETTEKIIIVDTARVGKAPGEYVFFSPDDVVTQKKLQNFSTHEGDILKVLELAKGTHYKIPEIEFMGIEPELIKPDCGLSETLKSKIHDYSIAALNRLCSSS